MNINAAPLCPPHMLSILIKTGFNKISHKLGLYRRCSDGKTGVYTIFGVYCIVYFVSPGIAL